MIARQQDGVIKPSANGNNIFFIYIYHGHNIVGQQLTPNIFRCYMLHPFALPVACCWELLCKV